MSHKFNRKMSKKENDKKQQKATKKMRHLRPVPFVSDVERKEK